MMSLLRRAFGRRSGRAALDASEFPTAWDGALQGVVMVSSPGMPDGYEPPSGALEPRIGLNAAGQHCVAYPGAPSTWTITEGGRTSGPIPYNAPPEWPGDRKNMSIPDLENRFRYHPPQTEQRRQAHETVRSGLLTTAERLDELLPDGREKSLAITKLEEAMFWANASLARQPDTTG